MFVDSREMVVRIGIELTLKFRARLNLDWLISRIGIGFFAG